MGKIVWIVWLLAGLLSVVAIAAAQNNGAVAPPPSTPLHSRRPWVVIGGPSKTAARDDTDDLKDFNHALAVQATSEQVSAYNSMVRSSEAAGKGLQALVEQLQSKPSGVELSSASHGLYQAVQNARNEARQFLEAFSKTQQAGLKDIALKLTKADSDLAQQATRLDQRTGDANPDLSEISDCARNLSHALTNFADLQVSLGKEMGVSQDISFSLPPTDSSIHVEGQPISITVAGTMSKVAAEGNQSAFKLEMTTDLSDLQHNIAEILRSRLDTSPRCGERHSLRWAAFTGQNPVASVVTRLHFEHWVCFMSLGQEISNEVAEGDGTLTVKLTPLLEPNNTLQLAAEISRIDADGWAGDLLRSDQVGMKLRDEIRESLLAAIRTATNLKETLPELAQDSTTINKAEFYEAGGLHVALYGMIRISDQQLRALGSSPKSEAPAQAASQE
ncbi:MAG TPA: hypothetical protein VEG68_12580 [Terriglobales bacterium]|nr:hypothetical protein [Terriglobales bacterium]